jgi:hypothetical protein
MIMYALYRSSLSPIQIFPVSFGTLNDNKMYVADTFNYTRRWVDNIKIDLLEIGWGRVDWIGLVQDGGKWRALVTAVMNLGNYRVS